jgi:hypothetical protein
MANSLDNPNQTSGIEKVPSQNLLREVHQLMSMRDAGVRVDRQSEPDHLEVGSIWFDLERDSKGRVVRIAETDHSTGTQLAIQDFNSGAYFDSRRPPITSPEVHPFSAGDISAAGVDQSGLGDCWFESALAALANKPGGAEKIAQMITQREDGSYKVTFPGYPKHPIIVTKAELQREEEGDIPKIGDSQPWASVMEAALLKFQPSKAHNGADGGDGIEILLGERDAKTYGTENISKAQLSEMLEKGIVTCSTEKISKSGSKAGSYDTNEHGIITKHGYSVISFQNDMVTVRNPWGDTEENLDVLKKHGIHVLEDGELQMSYATWKKAFDDYSC